jgi:lipopolysaccharide export system protein LptA
LSSRNKSEIYAQQATWDIAAKKVDASGSVIYKQINPEMQLSGDQAVGSLQTNQMVVTSQSGNKVVTQIYPKQKLSNN